MKSMELEIRNMATHPDCSPVITGNTVKRVKELPEGLRVKMMELLRTLERFDVGTVVFIATSDDKSILLMKKSGGSCTPEDIPYLDARKDIKETVGLLAWYFKNHFGSGNRAFGASVTCNECGRSQNSLFDPNKCQNSACASHEKMLAIDPSYVPTTEDEDPVARRFRKMTEEIIVSVQPCSSLH